MIDILMISRHCIKRLTRTTHPPTINYPGVGEVTRRLNTIHFSVDGSTLVGMILEVVVDHKYFEINFEDHPMISVAIYKHDKRPVSIS